MKSLTPAIGAVVIGRNEGDRLRICFESLMQHLNHIVYVDSGSTDGSVELAQKMNITVLPLDLTQPFTAARARNAGFNALYQQQPQLKYVQFIDGDCQLDSNWLMHSANFLEQHGDYAIACGARRERYPEQSIYNLLCDLEWNTPIGDAAACGGDALIRISAFKQVSGYNDELIAGEEPEMCFRLRERNWKIRRLNHQMTLHDAAISQFKQWWQRCKRSGFAYANGSYLHGNSPEKYWVKETRSIVFWGGLLPIGLVLLSVFLNPWFWAGFLVYLAQIGKIILINPIDKKSLKISGIYACFVMLSKFPQILGIISFYTAQLLKRNVKLIEYK